MMEWIERGHMARELYAPYLIRRDLPAEQEICDGEMMMAG